MVNFNTKEKNVPLCIDNQKNFLTNNKKPLRTNSQRFLLIVYTDSLLLVAALLFALLLGFFLCAI